MNRTLRILLVAGLLASAGGSAFAQTATPTQTPTITPTVRATIAVSGYSQSSAISISGPGNITTTFSYATGASLSMAHGDVIALVKVPKGAVIFDWYLSLPDMDSGSTLTLDFGLASNSAAFLSSSTRGQAGGLATPDNNPNGIVSGALPASVLTATDTVILRATAPAAGAGAGGTIRGWVRYHMHDGGF